MRSRKIPSPHSTVFRKLLQNPYGALSGSTYDLFSHSSTALAKFQHRLNIILDDQWTQCTSKLGEMLSLRRNTRDESDQNLIETISFASGAAIACLSAPRCSESCAGQGVIRVTPSAQLSEDRQSSAAGLRPSPSSLVFNPGLCLRLMSAIRASNCAYVQTSAKLAAWSSRHRDHSDRDHTNGSLASHGRFPLLGQLEQNASPLPVRNLAIWPAPRDDGGDAGADELDGAGHATALFSVLTPVRIRRNWRLTAIF